MRGFGMLGKVALIGAVLGLVSTSARAGYLVSLEQTGGGNAINVAPGDQFDVDVVLGRDVDVRADAFKVYLVFDYGQGENDTGARGFDYYSYAFGRGSSDVDVFVAGGGDDFSNPKLGSTALDGVNPATINRELMPAPNPTVFAEYGNDMNFLYVIDLKLEALSEEPSPGVFLYFDQGVLATLSMGIPDDETFVDGDTATIRLAVSGISGLLPGRAEIPFDIGSGLDVNIIPEPATLVLIGLGGLAVLRRRRSA